MPSTHPRRFRLSSTPVFFFGLLCILSTTSAAPIDAVQTADELLRVVKRSDISDITDSINMALATVSRTDRNSASNGAGSGSGIDARRIALLQNLNYIEDGINNLEAEKNNLKDIWDVKSVSPPSEVQNTAKALWRRTIKKLDVLVQKRDQLTEALKEFAVPLETTDGNNATDVLSPTPITNATDDSDAKKEADNRSAVSRIICQFFVFGTLFGVVLTITICTCFLQPKNAAGQSPADALANVASMLPSRIPQPFDFTKPCFLKSDESGRFYASPLDSEDIPPLPNYETALSMPPSPPLADVPAEEADLDGFTRVDVSPRPISPLTLNTDPETQSTAPPPMDGPVPPPPPFSEEDQYANNLNTHPSSISLVTQIPEPSTALMRF